MKQTESTKEDFINAYRLKIGSAIREIRVKRGYSQDHLSEIMHVNRTTISKIENGKYNLTIDYISKFSWFLDFDIIISENDEKIKNKTC